MLIIPAVDILNGECVRLTRGDYAMKKVYDSDPIAVALRFQADGARRLHVVDLDGARDSEPKNMPLILKLAKSLTIPIEVGGGIRSLETVRQYLSGGIDRIILGTSLVENPSFLETCVNEFGKERILVGLDVKKGHVATHGWTVTENLDYILFARELKARGVTQLIFTDIFRDGTLTMPAYWQIKELIALGFDVIASGGISSLESLQRLRQAGVSGAILGKALYEKRISLSEALRDFQ